MSFLTPLGLLGLIGLIVWLIIFIIKPNYQKKLISTTYVWMRSLKFRKKRLPTSRLRSILMIICQILAIISIATAMAQPFIAAPDEYVNEKIIILDASCDMLTTIEDGEENRFERAIAQIIQMSDAVLDADGIVTVILADNNPSYVVKQAGKQRPNEVAIEAGYALGHYFGDYANINYNYYLVLSSSDYDSNNSFYAAGTKFFLDIYAEDRPKDYSHIRVPNGVYTFNPNNDGKAGTFLESYSVYKEYDINGYQLDEKSYSEGTLTVTDDMLKLEVMFEGETNIYVVTYEGDYSMVDKRSESGAIY